MLIFTFMTLLYILYQYFTFLSYFHHISNMSVLSLSLIKSRHLGFTSCAAGIYAKLYINVWGFFALAVCESDCALDMHKLFTIISQLNFEHFSPLSY